MTPKQTALFNMAKTVGLSLVIGLGSGILLTTLPLAIIGTGLCLIGLGILAKMVYDIELSKAEHLEALNKLNETNK